MKRMRDEFAIVVDATSPLSLQHQVRQRLVDAITRGVLRPGRRLPSSRQLAQQVGVSRNTITLAYDALLAEGHLVSRPRSGIFVASEARGERVTTGRRGLAGRVSSSDRATPRLAGPAGFRAPPNWHQHPYPFLDGCIDAGLVPVDEWRETLRLAFGKPELLRWSATGAEPEDEKLTDELRTKVLPAWGIDAASEELLGAGSLRHALYLTLEAFVERSTPVVLDEGIEDELRRRLLERQTQVSLLEWKDDGAQLAADLPRGAVVILGPRRSPFGATLTRDRARSLLAAALFSDALVIECRTTPLLRESQRATPALRAIDKNAPVLLIGTLASVAALGEPPAFINGAARALERIRRLRHLAGSESSPGLQRAWAYFFGLGHYAAALSRASAVLQERRTALRDALNHYLHKFVTIRTYAGASAYWVRGGPNLSSLELARVAATHGLLIQPASEREPADLFCMGVTSLPKERIREGVERLARLIRRDPRLGSRQLRDETAPLLQGKALQRALADITLLYNTAYGEPCTIELRADGTLIGRAGYANEDCDAGRWWVENDRWVRQWNTWAYGERLDLFAVIDGDQMRWFNGEGLLIDTAVIVRRARGRSRTRLDP